MENIYTTQTQPNARPYPVKAALLAALAAVGFALLTPFFTIAAVLLPVSAALGAKVLCSRPQKLWQAVLPMLPGMLATVLLYNGTALELISMAALVPLTASAIAFMQLRRKGGFYTALAASLTCGVLLYAMIFLTSLFTEGDAFALVKAGSEAAVPVMQQMVDALTETVGKNNAYVTRFTEMLPGIVALITDMSMGIVFALAAAAGLAAAALFFRFTKNERAQYGLAAPGRFRDWSIPNSFTPGIFILFIAVFICRAAKMQRADTVYYTVSLGLLVPLCVQGLAFLVFMINSGKERKGLTVGVLVCAAVLFSAVSNLLVSIGALEQLMRLREKYTFMMKMKNGGGGAPQ